MNSEWCNSMDRLDQSSIRRLIQTQLGVLQFIWQPYLPGRIFCFPEWSRKRQKVPSLIGPSHRTGSVPWDSPHPPANLKGPRYPNITPLTFPHPQAHRWEHSTHPVRGRHMPSDLGNLPYIRRWNSSSLGLPGNFPDLCSIHHSALWLLPDLWVSPSSLCAKLRGAGASFPLTVIITGTDTRDSMFTGCLWTE